MKSRANCNNLKMFHRDSEFITVSLYKAGKGALENSFKLLIVYNVAYRIYCLGKAINFRTLISINTSIRCLLNSLNFKLISDILSESYCPFDGNCVATKYLWEAERFTTNKIRQRENMLLKP